ncbi:hypothetical protein JOC34_004123 [Virgibacillus halotolerans]|uniref:DUF3267 domain-containing protein n=1 Tax=Virgibacillus halotolerans TaxID=1071053 RepID=UPI0019604786|nr:DUF3267 domain-containing protein [Virgibacillus halotolerans]MBM7601695.1 hypothetical protein [Virgibacillus halotolerans]
MNCWKSINLVKEFGYYRLLFISFLIGLFAFILLYVPVSISHHASHVKESGFLVFIVALLLLPAIHSLTHIFPLIIMNKQVKIVCKVKNRLLPVFSYYTKYLLTKRTSLFVALAPTLFITIPGIAASCFYVDYYVYILLFTAAHIGFSFLDILYVANIVKAPKRAYIEYGDNGFDILLKASH